MGHGNKGPKSVFEASTELEAVRKDFAELKRVHDASCGHAIHLESVFENLIEENCGLKRRLMMHNVGTFMYSLFVLVASVWMLWFM